MHAYCVYMNQHICVHVEGKGQTQGSFLRILTFGDRMIRLALSLDICLPLPLKCGIKGMYPYAQPYFHKSLRTSLHCETMPVGAQARANVKVEDKSLRGDSGSQGYFSSFSNFVR